MDERAARKQVHCQDSIIVAQREHQQQIKVFNRILTWKSRKGIEYEADPRHVEIILQQLKFIASKAVSTSGIQKEGRTSEGHEIPLGDREATRYRATTARCNYLAPDRPDYAFAVKELARAMVKPTQGDLQRPKRDTQRTQRGSPGASR